eukprot:3434920-Lingulodinium_polyedra.AAC.1
MGVCDPTEATGQDNRTLRGGTLAERRWPGGAGIATARARGSSVDSSSSSSGSAVPQPPCPALAAA